MITILECLQNAEINLVSHAGKTRELHLGTKQLKNAIILLTKGYSVNDFYDSLIQKYGDVHSVPDKKELPHL